MSISDRGGRREAAPQVHLTMRRRRRRRRASSEVNEALSIRGEPAEFNPRCVRDVNFQGVDSSLSDFPLSASESDLSDFVLRQAEIGCEPDCGFDQAFASS
jgi:hypothetical protein